MPDGRNAAAQLVLVAPHDLLGWADRIRPHVARMAAGSGGRYESRDLFGEIASGRLVLWLGVAGDDVLCVMLGQLQLFPRKRAMRLIGLSGGRPNSWRRLLGAVEAQAKSRFGCDIMESLHRPRFLALLRGYLTTHWLSEKVL